MRRALLAAASTVLVVSAGAEAHHSFGAFYFEDQTVSVEGTITEYRYLNPQRR